MKTRHIILRPVSIFFLVLISALSAMTHAEEKSTCEVEKTRQDMTAMINRDVRVRLQLPGLIKEAEIKKGGPLTAKETRALAGDIVEADNKNRLLLDSIVAACGWPRNDSLGPEAVRIAAMIMVHAPYEFTHKYFAQMVESYKIGETEPIWMATVIDDALLEKGKPQRYGTRDNSLGTDGAQNPIEDPEHLVERRRAFGIMYSYYDTTKPFTGGEPRTFDVSQMP